MVFPWIKTLPRDSRFLYRFAKIALITRNQQKNNETVGVTFDALAKKIPNKPCFYFNDKVWTFREVEAESNRIGNYYAQQGFSKGDVVSLFMSNRIEVITTWLGLSKIGVVPALINSGLVSDMLKFSIEIVKPKGIICGYEQSEALGNVYPRGESRVPVFCTGTGDRGILSRATDVDKAIVTTGTETPVPKSPINYDDDLMYIYTSGTTGLPKAAIIKQKRVMMISAGMFPLLGMKSSDVLYTCLPLQHTAAGIIAAGFTLYNGTPLVLRSKFAASEYWKDCIKYKVTAAQYIGEICRYLLKQPVSPEETQHSLRAMFGNGLRPELWHEFAKRFKIPLINEVYGSTEGNCQMFNIFGHPTAIGFLPPLLSNHFPHTLIKLDDNDEPIRDPKTGLVVMAKIGEQGEIVASIVEGDPKREFKGYVGDETGSAKKILRDVVKKGDSYFRSGDLCVRDELGYFYFKDRIGDSIRFKGENISSTQIEGVINKITSRHDVVVFGVKVPNVDGSVGMAAIADPENHLDLKALALGIEKELPDYSRPRFLRVVHKIEDTMTHKLKKTDLKKEGYDLEKVGTDKVYFLNENQFQLLTPDLLKKLNTGDIKI